MTDLPVEVRLIGSRPFVLCALVCVASAGSPARADEDHGHPHAAPATVPSVYAGRGVLDATRDGLPPAPAGVADLDFRELFLPPGRKGLEYGEKARALEGKPVRMLGYMVQQDLPADGLMLLAPYPFTLHETEYGLAEDLPASVVHVVVTDRRGEKVPFTPGLLLLTGRLELGPREEPDGRISTVRLTLQPPVAQRDAAAMKHPEPPPHAEEKHR